VLLSNLSNSVTADFYFDFQVEGFELREGKGALALMIDNAPPASYYGVRCQITNMAPGYHLLRAFLIDEDTLQCLKTPAAYVEAEFYVNKVMPQPTRGYMFGQPSLCHLSPRGRQKPAVVDFFVHNCELAEAAYGFSVNIYVNDQKVTTVNEWAAYKLEGVTGEVKVRLVLVSPGGEELLQPSYNCETQKVVC